MRTSRRMLRQARSSMAACLFLSGLITLMMLATPYITVLIFQTVLPTGNFELLAVLAMLAAGAATARAILEGSRDTILLRTSLWLDHNLGEHILANGLKIARPASELHADRRALGHVTAFLDDGHARAILNAVWSPALLAALFALDVVFGCIASGAAALIWLVSVASPAAAKPQDARSNAWFNEAIAARAMTQTAASVWERLNRSHIAQHYSTGRACLTSRARYTALMALAYVALICAGAHLMIAGTVGAGHLLAAAFLLHCLILDLAGAAASAPALRKARAAHKHLIALPADAVPAAKLGLGPLELTAVSVVYSGRSNAALQDISISIDPGRCLLVDGPASSGKSTLLAVLAGAIQPSTGSAIIGGLPLMQRQRSMPRLPVSYAAVDAPIFDGTIAENIAGFSPADTMPVATAALRAGVHAIFAALPQAYETQVGPRGTLLSPRERAAVSLARALHGTPLVCVLDHPEFATGDAGLSQLVDTLRSMMRAGCGIAIATTDQRLAALAGEVAVLDGGRIQGMYRPQFQPHAA